MKSGMYQSGINALKGFLKFLSFVLLFVLASGDFVEGAIVNYTDSLAADLEQNSDEKITMTSNLVDANSNVVGGFVSTVYRNGSIYTYVLEVTPLFVNSMEFNMGRNPVSPYKHSGYNGTFGYDFEGAKNAFDQYGSGDHPVGAGDDIFGITLDSDNTIDWNVTRTYLDQYYAWQSGETITFFFEHTSAPVSGFYSLVSGSTSASTDGFTPASVPIPGTLLLLGCSMLGLITVRKRR